MPAWAAAGKLPPAVPLVAALSTQQPELAAVETVAAGRKAAVALTAAQAPAVPMVLAAQRAPAATRATVTAP
jgi:Holliday junction resolvasome RuvABC endonuclease subunit